MHLTDLNPLRMEQKRKKKFPVIRTFFANAIKYKLFIDIFADLALYRQKDYQKAIQQTFHEALKQIQHPDKPLVCITGSMGGEVAIDTLDQELQNSQAMANSLMSVEDELNQGKLQLKKQEILNRINVARQSVTQSHHAKNLSADIIEQQFSGLLKEMESSPDPSGNERKGSVAKGVESMKDRLVRRSQSYRGRLSEGTKFGNKSEADLYAKQSVGLYKYSGLFCTGSPGPDQPEAKSI